MTPLATLSTYFIFPIAILGLLMWNRLLPVQRRIAIGLLVISAFQALAIVLAAFHHSNLEGYHVYIIFELAIVLYIFQDLLDKLAGKYLMFIILAAFILLEIVQNIFISSFHTFPAVTRTVESILVIALGLSYFFDTMRRTEAMNLLSEPLFWVASAYTIYFACNLLLFAFGAFIQSQSNEVFAAVWDIHAVLNILLYSILLIALLCKPKPIK